MRTLQTEIEVIAKRKINRSMMELFLYSTIFNLFVAIFPILLLLLLLSCTLSSRARKNLPPGPTKLPIIGNLHNIVGSLPHRTLWRLSQKHGPLMHLDLGEFSAIVVSSSEMAREIMAKNDLSFASRPKLLSLEVCVGGSYNITFAPYGDFWRQMRKLCVVELLSHKRVQSFSSIREEEIQRLVVSIRSSSSSSSDLPINLTERVMGSISTTISRAVFGRKYDTEHASALASKIKESIHLAGGFGIADFYPSMKIFQILSPSLAKMKKISRGTDSALENMLDKHISEKPNEGEIEDLVDVLLRLQESDSLDVPITKKHIRAIIGDMFGGGTDTTATVIEWAMAEMVKNPRVMEKAQGEIRRVLKGKKIIKEEDIQEMSYLQLVIKETLRLHPPAPLLLPRECRESCVVSGFEIPIKTKVLINAWAIGRDPKYWENPEVFDPERFANSCVNLKGTNNSNFEYIPFGGGRRICPGITFGLANVELALTQLLYHFDWNLPDHMKPENLDMTELFGATVGRKFDLLLMAVPFTPVEE